MSEEEEEKLYKPSKNQMERRQGRKFFSLREELRRAAIERHQVMAATPSAPPLQPENEVATDASLYAE